MTFTQQEFESAVSQSTTIRQVLEKLGINGVKNNYRVFHKLLKQYPVDTTHFEFPTTTKPRRELQEYFNNIHPIGSARLKERMFKEGIKAKCCEKCLLSEWNQQVIPLELHHIDGNHMNNNLLNLQVLCPNCHAQTTNYRGANASVSKVNQSKKKVLLITKTAKPDRFCHCGNILNSKQKFTCSYDCDKIRQRKVTNRPSKEELIQLLETNSFCAVGRMYNVSDNAVRKWLKSPTQESNLS